MSNEKSLAIRATKNQSRAQSGTLLLVTMSKPYARDFFVANRWILRCAGLWPPEIQNRAIQIAYKAYSIAIFLFVNCFFTASEFVSLYYTYNSRYHLIKNVGFGLTHLMGAVKGRQLKDILAVLESEEFHYDSCKEQGFDVAGMSAAYKKTGIIYTILFSMLAHATLTSSYLPPTLVALAIARGGEKQLPTRLPYYSWMPFRYDTPGTYLVALGYQAIAMFSYAYSIVGMDTLFMNIMNCIAFNLTAIQGAFLTVRERCARRVKGRLLTPDRLHDSEALTRILKEEIKTICHHLQTIYKYGVCHDLENLHKYITLAQVIATLFILCSCLYLVSTTPIISKQFYAEILYMITMGFQLILYCWFGNEVTLKASFVFTVTFFSLTPHRVGGGIGDHVINSASVSYKGVIHCRIIGEILENFLSFCWCAVSGRSFDCLTPIFTVYLRRKQSVLSSNKTERLTEYYFTVLALEN
ncbi:hypothetical protein NQ318_015145 [Aromia moschata]|uniref:Odorant receptor n=1 Tax=Aromia moschata TaxID=1265417 RepID=A0AAV8X6Y9_9CUCU|nr:hypothetical protein NQ318_015145 [Aromia moschata]